MSTNYPERALTVVSDRVNHAIETEVPASLFGLGGVIPDDFYVVWFSKTLGNWKALVSTDVVDGHYFEVTHNGAKNETYVDWYTKQSNAVVTELDITVENNG